MLPKQFLSKSWQEFHLRQIKYKAGARYTPTLNVETPIAEYFDGLSRNKVFRNKLSNFFGEIERSVIRSPSHPVDDNLQILNHRFNNTRSKILESLASCKKYNVQPIPWNKIQKLILDAQNILWDITLKLREEKERLIKEKNSNAITYPIQGLSSTDNVELILQDVNKIAAIFHELDSFSKGIPGTLANKQFLLIKGESGIGKTHLLCDLVKVRYKENTPLFSLLLFGEEFEKEGELFKQISTQLSLKNWRKDGHNILKRLDGLAKKTGARSFLIIDALNETNDVGYWKKNLKFLVERVKKYPNIALILSIRNEFEDEIFTKKILKQFQVVVHEGFRYREWEAITTFFDEFKIPLPEIPLLVPEFENPLFLLLFCKAFADRKSKSTKNKKRQIFRGHEGATYIFENFVKNTADRVAKNLNVPSGRDKNGKYFIWDTIIESVAEKMVTLRRERLSEKEVLDILYTAHPNINAKLLLKELEQNLLLVKVLHYPLIQGAEKFDYRFPFQKFSDHLIVRFIYKKCKDNHKTPKQFFSKNTLMGKFVAEVRNRGLIEALSIQCPEMFKGVEFFEVATYLDIDFLGRAFINSLVWRRVDAFDPKKQKILINFINGYIHSRYNHSHFLGTLLSTAPVPDHPFNAKFLHLNLMGTQMPMRDSWWSKYLDDEYQQEGAVDRLIQWAWSTHDKTNISNESIKLCAIPLIWFCSSSNRALRDKTTKALVNLLTDRLSIILELIEKFQRVDDLYVLERLYAVAYGCILRNKDDTSGAQVLSKWVLDNFFTETPLTHILIRDYARGIVEVGTSRGLLENVPHHKIHPPFNSDWPKNIPSKKTLMDRFSPKNNTGLPGKDYYSIWSSVMYNITEFPGDFGKYVINPALEKWSGKRLNGKRNSKTREYFDTGLAQRWIFKRVLKLGWSPKLHNEIDKNLNYGTRNRYAGSIERIGKKYQWIALYEFAALVSDHYKYKREKWTTHDKKYIGPWQLYLRNIDPSCCLKMDDKKVSGEIREFANSTQDSFLWNKQLPLSDWLSLTKKNIPSPKSIIEVKDNTGIIWLMLKSEIDWGEGTPPDKDARGNPRRKIWYFIKSYLAKENNKNKFINWAKKQDCWGDWMLKSGELHDTFIGEFPESLAFKYYNIPYYYHNGWTKSTIYGEDMPAKILVTNEYYSSKVSSYDFSLDDESIPIHMPSKWLVEKMKLSHKYTDGRFFDTSGTLIAFDPSVYDKKQESCLLMRKDKLVNFLSKDGYSIVWTILGEKQVIGGNIYQDAKGWPRINGVLSLSDNCNITGTTRWQYPYQNRGK